MNEEFLPPELQELEAELTAAFRAELPDDLRPRVAKSMREELRRRKTGSRWSFAAVAAAAALVWMNLSLCATSATDFYPRVTPHDGPNVGAIVNQLREILPELSQDEAASVLR